ncbi:MAG: hypothetical protein A2Y41_01430 [Spirochaetes bacterium GWB1_36_13]|nr:MAG: hypothetical protein A2Y41_01430 [Spirochaetes bacterium GWB1_36_13]
MKKFKSEFAQNKKNELFSSVNLIINKVENLENGDLFLISEIKEDFENLQKQIEKNSSIECCLQDFAFLIEAFLFTNENEAIKKSALESLKDIILFYKNEIDINILNKKHDQRNQKINQIKEKMQLNESLSDKYSKNYFNNIIQDEKMLSQLCDEINDHMNKAQYTLVDLEYDETNQENINKIFRAFHTAKGSSAFLGLKNIEEVGHQMENLLVLVRDGKLRITSELIDVIFIGIELLRNLTSIMEVNQFKIEKMVESFKKVDIFSYIRLIKKILEQYSFKKIGQILEEEGLLRVKDVKHILQKQKETSKKFGEIAVEEKMITPTELENAVNKQTSSLKKSSYVRVSNDRLNLLVDTVGELVINQSMLRQILTDSKMDNKAVRERVISQLEGISTNIKNIVLSMGMVPIAEVFNKLRVVIRNTTTELGKAVIVDIRGEDTELDRNVIETIYDPLVHIVRNAVDHGIEFPGEREKGKKDRVGKIIISAEHKGNGIEISVWDDGKGIKKERIIEKALQLGLLGEDKIENLTEKEIYNLMFQPGFSTAEKVTEVSGRGVGLDVVKKNIDEIRGKIEIFSKEKEFTKFVIKLPLTLAIIEGFVTEVGENKYIFPFNLVDEIIVPQEEMLSIMDNGTMMLFNRGIYIPVIFSGKIFGESEYKKDTNNLVAIIIFYDNKHYAVVVDKVIGKQETVIKNLSEVLNDLAVFSGGTIFGDGTIGFVVDLDGFLDKVKDLEEKIKKN